MPARRANVARMSKRCARALLRAVDNDGGEAGYFYLEGYVSSLHEPERVLASVKRGRIDEGGEGAPGDERPWYLPNEN